LTLPERASVAIGPIGQSLECGNAKSVEMLLPRRPIAKRLSSDARELNLGRHALCWVHAERLVHKLDTFTDQHRAAQQRLRHLIWWFYSDLKAYCRDPTPLRKAVLRARFDRIFKRRTGLCHPRPPARSLHANKPELLMVLDRPEIPLHTNGSETTSAAK